MMERAAKRAATGVALLRAAGVRGVFRGAGNRTATNSAATNSAGANPPAMDPPAMDPPAVDPPDGGEPSGDGTVPTPGAAQPGALPPPRASQAGLAAQAGQVATAGQALTAGQAAGPVAPGPDAVPRWLRVSAAWSWRLLLLAGLLYVAGRVAALLYIVIVPFAAAILLTALLQPLTARLRRAGLGPLAATSSATRALRHDAHA